MGKWNPVDAWRQTLDFLIAGEFDRCAFADDCQLTDMATGLHTVGWDQLREAVSAFSNVKATFVNSVASGNKCAVEGEYEMIHSRDWVPTPEHMLRASGKPVRLKASYFLTFDREGEGALITRMSAYYNLQGLIEQTEL